MLSFGFQEFKIGEGEQTEPGAGQSTAYIEDLAHKNNKNIYIQQKQQPITTMKSFQAVILAAILLLHSYSTSMSYSYSGKGGKSGGGKGGKSDSKATKATKTPKVAKSGGGGGCAWPLDQNLCLQGQGLGGQSIKYTVCPTANQEGNAVAEYYNPNGGTLQFIDMDQYINSTAYMDPGGNVVVLVNDVTVKYGSNIVSANYC